MYKNTEKQREANRLANKRYRAKGITPEGITEQGITQKVRYPALVLALADPVKRGKIQRITDSLKRHNQLDNVRYGIFGPTFKSIDKLLSG